MRPCEGIARTRVCTVFPLRGLPKNGADYDTDQYYGEENYDNSGKYSEVGPVI